jgi:uncharacterized protein YjbK
MQEHLPGRQESELKFRVDGPIAFQTLEKVGKATPRRIVTQTNHFFDTSDGRLDRAKHTIRLRDEGGVFTLTIKGPERKSSDGALTQKAEEEITLSKEEAQLILTKSQSPLTILALRAQPTTEPLLKTILSLIGDGQLIYIGAFQNERTTLPITLEVGGRAVDFVFEMDKTSFPGGHVHYEVEVELMGLRGVDVQAAADTVRAFFDNAQVRWQSGPSKAKRFFNVIAGRAIE